MRFSIRQKKFIAVIGGGECTPEVAKLAEDVGRELARRGAVVVCGGLGGVMEAACKGAQAEGGLTIGILPGNRRADANPYVQIPIVTGLGEARNVAVIKSAQAVIAIDGSYGTLSEIGVALKLDIPVIGLMTWGLTLNNQADTMIIPVATAEDAAELAVTLAGK